MRIHAIQAGTVAIKKRQQRGKGEGTARLVNTLLDHEWTEPLPIYAWVIEHPEGLIVVDTGETARTSEPGYFPAWASLFQTRSPRSRRARRGDRSPDARSRAVAR